MTRPHWGPPYTARLALMALGFWAPGVGAQQTSTPGTDAPEEARAPAPPDTASAPGNTLVPLPVVFYQPETGVGFGVAASYYTRLTRPPRNEPDLTIPPSVFQLIGIYTLESQIITALRGELYWGGTRYRALLDLGYVRFPTRFWGIGNDTPEEAEERYTPERVNLLGADLQRELSRGWYAGVTVRAVRREITRVEEGGLIDSGVVPGSEDGWSLGLGLVGTRDTRSSATFPESGSLHQLRATFHSSAWGSDFEYGAYLLDLRRYLSAGAGRKVLALRAVAMASSGTPPFDQLPQIGGDQLLRGYFQGRFTDRQLVALQAEYRGPAFWRLGWVAFGGAGQVADRWSGFDVGGFKASVGGGLRFLVSDSESLFIRADFGYGVNTGSTGFYLNIGEAF